MTRASSSVPNKVSLADIVRLSDGESIAGRSSEIPQQASPTLKELTECVSFSPGDGRIWLNDQRMLLFHGKSFGVLRQQVIDTLGLEQAKRLFMRVGYASGARDAELVKARWPDATPASIFAAGTSIHSLEGAVKVETVHFEFDVAKGRYDGEFLWHNSCEAEQHVHSYGVCSTPVCWMEVGYAIGYVSCLLGSLVIFREIECLGMGHAHCRIIGKNANYWPKGQQNVDFLTDSEPLSNIAQYDTETAPLMSQEGEEEGADNGRMIGASPAFLAVSQALDKVAKTQATVLLSGESGVGKELFAQQLHRKSKRHQGPFVAFNCAAIPDNLIEAELFGVEKGAFTGATNSRPGRFERANGGTLFLDELGTLSLSGQSKLLRALQEKEIERVGGINPIKVNVRVVAATNLALLEAVRDGAFREDLYYRLNVFPITLPPLRERRDDIPLLVNYFFHRFCQAHEKTLSGITMKASQALFNYDFPGNIRELQNIIERGVIWAEENGPVDIHHMFQGESLPQKILYSLNEVGELNDRALASNDNQKPWLLDKLNNLQPNGFSLEELERKLLSEAVALENNNLSAAARRLGISRAQLAYRLKKLLKE